MGKSYLNKYLRQDLSDEVPIIGFDNLFKIILELSLKWPQTATEPDLTWSPAPKLGVAGLDRNHLVRSIFSPRYF